MQPLPTITLRNAILLLCVLAIVALALWPALSGGFIFDDYPVFVENPTVHVTSWHVQPWRDLLLWSRSHLQRPLAMLSFALNYACGANAWGLKATNLVIHLFNTVLVFALSRRFVFASWAAEQPDTTARHGNYWAIGIAAAWAIHPLNVSAVMYVVQRMELLGFTFVAMALLAYWRARQLQCSARRAWPWLLLSAAITFSGYFAKETVVLVPGYALLLELTLLRFSASQPSVRHAWKVTYVLGCIFALVVFCSFLLPHFATAAAFSGRDYTAWQRVMTQLRVLPMYLCWSALPILSQMHFYYDNYPASSDLLHPLTTLLGGILLAGLLALAILVRHKRPLLALGIGWFFMAHAITSGPVALELVFEHRNYPALLGVILAAADVLWLITRRLPTQLPAIIGTIVVLNFGFLTALRAATWGDSFLLAQTLVETNPGSARAALDLARRYVSMSGDNPDSPMYSLGIHELGRGAALPASSILPEEALLIQIANHPGWSATPWWESLQEKLRTRSMGPEVYLALNGLLEARLGSNPSIDAKQLARAYDIAISRDPKRIGLHIQYANLASLALYDSRVAAEQWRQVLELQKNSPGAAVQLATYLVESHRDREALAVIADAQGIQPELRVNATLESLRAQAQQRLNGSAETASKN